MQYVVDDLRAIAGMADAQPQAPEVRADVRDDVAQAVVTAVTAAQFETGVTDRQIEFVVRDQNFGRRNFHVIGNRAHGKSAAIHIRHRLEQRDFLAAERHATNVALESRMTSESPAPLGRKCIDKPEPRVVTREQMLGAWIAETDDDFEGSAWHLRKGDEVMT